MNHLKLAIETDLLLCNEMCVACVCSLASFLCKIFKCERRHTHNVWPCAAAVMTTSTPADVINLFGVFSVSLSGQQQRCYRKYPGDKPLFKGVCVRIL